MMYWIRRGTRLLCGFVFFLVLITMMLSYGSFGISILLKSLIYASVAAILFWFVGFVIFDIIFKGVITHIEGSTVESLVDGGLLQQVHIMQENLIPGGKELPFTTTTTTITKTDDARIKNKKTKK